jgi:hypothetical protein
LVCSLQKFDITALGLPQGMRSSCFTNGYLEAMLSLSSSPLIHRANAGAHLLPEAGATQERTLEAVRCSALFGPGLAQGPGETVPDPCPFLPWSFDDLVRPRQHLWRHGQTDPGKHCVSSSYSKSSEANLMPFGSYALLVNAGRWPKPVTRWHTF